VDEALIDAYGRTAFVADMPRGRLTLRVGARSPELDDLLLKAAALSWAFVTAWNPGSVRVSDLENRRRSGELAYRYRRVRPRWREDFVLPEVGEERTLRAEGRRLGEGVQAEIAPLEPSLAQVAPLGKGDRLAVVATGTVKSYRHLLKLYIRPALGTTKLAEVQRAHIKDLLAAKREAKLSKNTVRLIRATLSVLFSDAVDDGLLQTNPTLGLARKGRKRADAMTGTERRQAIRPLSVEQLATFLASAEDVRQREARDERRDARPAEEWRDRRDYALFLTLADAGLRPGEALALKWEDVDVGA